MNIILKTQIQAIMYQTRGDALGITHATSTKRISIAEAEDILADRGIEYKEILKVKYEHVDLEIPLTEYENYLTL